MKKVVLFITLALTLLLISACKSTESGTSMIAPKDAASVEKSDETSKEESLDYIKGRPLTEEEIEEQKKHEPSNYGYQEDSIVVPSIHENSNP